LTYVLGLDLGARSLGWAAIARDGDGYRQILGIGVRVFEAGVEGLIEKGREESRAAQRRIARLARRQTRRRRQRARQLYHALAGAGLLPPVSHAPSRPEAIEIQRTLNELDCDLRRKYADCPGIHQLPYLLRARGLDEELAAFELGRALYHLGQRRGFKSSRKAKVKKTDTKTAEDENGAVYAGIHELEARMAGKRTLGEYLASLDPAEERIRSRYTHRSMYEAEFEAIWAAQAPHHSALTDDFKQRVYHMAFDQRPLRDSSELVGRCEWDPEMKRAELWRPEYQRFRILQTANHLRVADPDGVEHRLTGEQRQRLIDALEFAKELNLTRAKKIIGIPLNWKFSLEKGGETKFKGDAVACHMSQWLGEAWDAADAAGRTEILEGIDGCETDESLAQFLERRCSMTPGEARRAAEGISLPTGYASLSLESLRRVLPYMEQGLSVQEARQAAGFALSRETPMVDFLPALKDSRIEVRNPAVARALTETRKVVNAAIREWGKPDEIHIEMARELRKTQDQRRKDVKTMRDRGQERDAARTKIETEAGLTRIGRKEIDLVLLYEECGGICPYSGQPLGGLASILNGTAAVQVEHVVPRSVCLDDSFANSTLATVEANREKGNRTPWEAFGADEERFAEIIGRVKSFRGAFARRKLERFQMRETGKEKLLSEFSDRQLNDTRYSSRLAAEYLGVLYGGETAGGKRHILKSTGQLTAELRGLWRLNEILSGDSRKSREDHRHHAIDAAVLAVLGQGWIQRLSEAAERAWAEGKRRYASVEPPWLGFKEELREVIGATHISYRPEHRISGGLHKDSNYSYMGKNERDGDVVRIRRPVHLLTVDDVDRIVDAGVREVVRAKVAAVGDLKKLESDPPFLKNQNGAPVPIRKVRIELNRSVRKIGKGHKARYAEGGESHHVEVCEVTENGRRAWRGDPVPMSDAMERLVAGKPVVDRSDAGGRGFLFSLCKDDTVELQDPLGSRSGIWVVKKIKGNQQVVLVPERDARPEGAAQGKEKREVYSPTVSGLRGLSARKVVVDPLGRVFQAHD